jgi:hypothetical protein
MGETNQPIQPSTAEQKRPAKAADPLEELTPKQRIFLNLLVEGEAPQVAYKKAGYEGEPDSCYQLKSRLDKQLTMIAISRGMAKSDLVLGMKKLNELPISRRQGRPRKGHQRCSTSCGSWTCRRRMLGEHEGKYRSAARNQPELRAVSTGKATRNAAYRGCR